MSAPTESAPKVEHPLQVVHAVPGRMRFRWRELRTAPPERAGEIADACIEEDGFLDVSVSLATGSILVVYDPAMLSFDEVTRTVQKATGAEKLCALGEELPPLPAPPVSKAPSKLAIEAASFFERVNDDVRRATDGQADLATLMPLTFVGLGLIEVGVSGEMPAPPWWSLFWWSFRSFISLNDPAIKAASRACEHEEHDRPAAAAT